MSHGIHSEDVAGKQGQLEGYNRQRQLSVLTVLSELSSNFCSTQEISQNYTPENVV